MPCPCGVDHWLHLATGLSGIVSMMHCLTEKGVVASDDGIARMKSELLRLHDEIVAQEQARKGA